jgi:hypothetical protein
MINKMKHMIKLGCNCATCGCSRWFWTTAPIWVAIGIAIGYWCLGGSGDIGTGAGQ